MRQTTIPVSFALGVAFALLSPALVKAQSARPSVLELKLMVDQKKEELVFAQIALASAQAKLARAEGKTELAVSEWRKVIAYHEGRLKDILELCAQGKACFIEQPLQEAWGEVAMARAWLADVEGRKDDLRTELAKVIEYHEYRIRRYALQLKHKVISEEEAREPLKVIEEELQRAKEQLASLKATPASQNKNGKDGKP
jgi:hypothetical protein